MNKRKVYTALLLLIFLTPRLSSSPDTMRSSISGLLNWENGDFDTTTELDLASVGLRLPSGRIRGEEILREEYLSLIRPLILSVQVDSSSTVEDLIRRLDFNLRELDDICLEARTIPPSFSVDLTRLIGRYTINLSRLSAALIKHRRPGDINPPLIPSPSADYTGIIIIADNSLPIHGRNTLARVQPCLFPKIWDTDMNLIYEKNFTNPAITGAGEKPIVHYTHQDYIFRSTPSGLDETLIKLVGERPLRIIARSVYGIVPTDPVIDRDDALLILSTENNRRLLNEGRVVMVLDRALLQSELGSEF